MIEIRAFDPDAASRAEWAAVHTFRRARLTEDAPDDPVEDDAEHERQARHRWPLHDSLRWHAWEGDAIVGDAGAGFRREGTASHEDQAAHLHAWGGVLEPRRRRGIGKRLLRPVLDLMGARGMTVATLGTSTAGGEAFLRSLGADLKHRQIENRAAIDALDWDLLERWVAAVPADAGLRWEVHPRRVPRERMELLIPELDALIADVPQGGLDEPPFRIELPAWLAAYEELDRRGGDHLMVLLTDGDAVAAACEMGWDARFPDRVYQQLTAVARPWRGRGLAKAVKAALLRLVRERHPEVRLVRTHNADVNAPMLSINRRLGFAEHRRALSFQITRDGLAAALDGAGPP